MPTPCRYKRSLLPSRWSLVFTLIVAALVGTGLRATSTAHAAPVNLVQTAPDSLPVADLTLSPALQMSHAQSGATLVYHYAVSNNTAAAMQITLQATSRQGWSLTLSPTSVQVGPNSSTAVDLTVQAGAGVTDRITLTASTGATIATAAIGAWTVAQAFGDIDAQNWAYDFVQFLVGEGALSGYADSSFRPNNPLTRAQFAKMLVSGMGWPLVQPAQATFNDVPATNWAFPYVETAAQRGVLAGYQDHTFRPNNSVTRAQLTKAIVNARGWTLLAPPDASFSDVDTTNWAFPFVETAVDIPVLAGYADGSFHPNAAATRAQVAKILLGGLLLQQNRHVVPAITPTPPAPPQSTPTPRPQATPTMPSQFTPTPPPAGGQIYWGAYIKGTQYGTGDAPYDPRAIDMFEAHAQKRTSIVAWGQSWYTNGHTQPFEAADYETVRLRGGIGLVDWEPWDSCCGANQSNWRLSAVINGTYDAYIRQWATDARAYGHPFFVRMGEEMNGTWYPWSEEANGNYPGEFVQMWRHVHDIFTQVGASNVTWVWNPNREWDSSQPLEGLYPGAAYVDWVALDGYNWGNNPSKGDVWTSFTGVFGPSIDHLTQLAPGKPIMIAETASTEDGGSKADWITDALSTQLPLHYPQIKALVWFNWNADSMDWVIETSSAAQNAFVHAIAAPYFAPNNFANLPPGPVQPPR
jgi:beta-mannanase